MSNENWKPVVGWEYYYSVSDTGNVKSEARFTKGKKNKTIKERILKSGSDRPKDGYRKIWLTKDCKTTGYLIHRLVYEAFVGIIPLDYEIDHIDGNKENNKLNNLQCLPYKAHRALTVARHQHASGETTGNSKLKEDEVKIIKALLKERITHKIIAKRFQVHHSTIASIADGRTWCNENSSEYNKGHRQGFKEGYAQGYQDAKNKL